MNKKLSEQLISLGFCEQTINLINTIEVNASTLNELEIWMIENNYSFIVQKKRNSKLEDEFYLFNDLIKSNFTLDDKIIKLALSEHKCVSTLYFHHSIFKMYIQGIYQKNDLYNLLSLSSTIIRTGWIKSKVKCDHLESISEHMFEMNMLANMYLDNVEETIKQDVLDMILIHDLVETITGDIPHPNKTKDDEFEEILTGCGLFANMIYLGLSCGKRYYKLWLDWCNANTKSALLAHDFDIIQLAHKFLTYAIIYKSFDNHDIIKWLSREPQTEEGRKIYREVILNNDTFKDKLNELKNE